MTRETSVTVAYMHGDNVAHSWHESLIELLGYDIAHAGNVLRGGFRHVRPATGALAEGRNEAVAAWLKSDAGEWLWWVDDDMGFAPDTVDRLLEVADPAERPIVSGLCFAYRESGRDGMGGFVASPRPTIFDWVKPGTLSDKPEFEGFVGRRSYQVGGVTRCAGTGSACILIHRSVFERMRDELGGEHWYTRVPAPDGSLLPEDLSFCARAGALDIPIFVHAGVRTTHQKTIWLNEQHFWSDVLASPAREPVAVLVPVLNRPQNAEPFMRSLRASTGLATVYAICEDGDTDSILAWKREGAEVSVGAAHTFAEKVNVGRRESHEPWLFLVGDDVRFHPGWLDHAQATAGDSFHVIGTNDLGNPRVMAGEHGTHLLVRRSYVDEVGASWDGPGVVTHEGYHHWYVDDEIVTAAKQRGVWAMALGSVVEHLHPAWKKAESDPVYELGQAFAKEDGELFNRRARAHFASENVVRRLAFFTTGVTLGVILGLAMWPL